MNGLRPGLPADLERLASIHVETWQAAYAGLIPAPLLAKIDLDHGRRRLVKVLGQEPTRVLVLEGAEGAIGFCRFGPARDEGVAEVFALNLRPAHWRQGHGRRLLEGALECLRAEGFAEVWLWVLAGNQRARAFYESLGWAPDGAERVEGAAQGARLEEVRYRTSLSG